ICFVPNGSYADVVAKLRPGAIDPGEIVDLSGAVLGRHDGIINFTVGQRRGLGIAHEEPLYVVRLDPAARRVIVGPKEALLDTRLRVRDLNWLGDAPLPGEGLPVSVKLRSAQAPVAARALPLGGDNIEVVLDEPCAGIAPGQACVMYEGERVLGGGWIVRDAARAQAA
ncbi:MAG: tRNA 2-thiouridine(34) synthase MnmA, partial [Rhodospirillales bacterium]